MIAAAPFAPKADCRSWRADPVTAGACTSAVLDKLGVMAVPRQADDLRQPKQRFCRPGSEQSWSPAPIASPSANPRC
jgi:hypothetical protein